MLGLVQRAGVRLPRDALNVAVSERPHRRPGRGIVRRDRTILVQPQDLSREHARVLCVRAVFGIAGRDVELAVGTELEATAIVSVIARDPVEDDRLLCPESILVAHANDLVSSHSVRRPVAVVEVDESVLREVGVESDPEKPLLAVAAGGRGESGPRVGTKPAARAELNDPHATRALGDEEPAVRREVDRPGRSQSRRHELHVLDDCRTDAGRGGRTRARRRRRRGRRDRDRCRAGGWRRCRRRSAREKEEQGDEGYAAAAGGTGSGVSARCAGPTGPRPRSLATGAKAQARTGRVRERGRAAARDRTRPRLT